MARYCSGFYDFRPTSCLSSAAPGAHSLDVKNARLLGLEDTDCVGAFAMFIPLCQENHFESWMIHLDSQ